MCRGLLFLGPTKHLVIPLQESEKCCYSPSDTYLFLQYQIYALQLCIRLFLFIFLAYIITFQYQIIVKHFEEMLEIIELNTCSNNNTQTSSVLLQ